MIIEDVSRTRDYSFNAVVKVPNLPAQEPAIVNELLTQEVISALETGLGLSELGYVFFEGFHSWNGMPGFAVFGTDHESKYQKGRERILSVKYYSSDLADRTDIPERFFTSAQPIPSVLSFGIEVPVSSPLVYFQHDSRYDSDNPAKALVQLIDNLNRTQGIDERLIKPESFYQQFEGNFIFHNRGFDAEMLQRLAEPDPIDGCGKYVLVVEPSSEKGYRFQQGKVIEVHTERGWFDMSGSHPLDKHIGGVGTGDKIAVLGKGLTPLYFAERSEQSTGEEKSS